MLSIPPGVTFVFILSDGSEHILDASLFSELAKIYKWFNSREEEFNADLRYLQAKTDPGNKSVLKITSDGKKELIANQNKSR